MSNEEFLVQLEQLLQGKMPLQEIQNVMDYHREYFAEAGENAAAELDPPEVIARRVLDEYFSPPPRRERGFARLAVVAVLCAVLAVAFIGVRRHGGRFAIFSQDTYHTVREATSIDQVTVEAGTAIDQVTIVDGGTSQWLPQEFESIVIEGVSDNVVITRGVEFSVAAQHNERETMDCVVKDNTLHITGSVKGALSTGFEKGNISITVPEQAGLSTIRVNTDMGGIYLDGINAGEVELRAELGDISVSSGLFTSLNCDSDLGDISVSSVMADALQCTCDDGSIEAVEFAAMETGLVADLGSITAVAVGVQSDYALELAVDLGELRLNGLKASKTYTQNATDRTTRFLSAKADVGNITLDFVADEGYPGHLDALHEEDHHGDNH